MPTISGSFSRIIEVGHLRQDPKTRLQNSDASKVRKFTLEIDLNKGRNVLLRVIANDELADFIAEHGKKNSLVRVKGDDIIGRVVKDEAGKETLLMELIAKSVEFLDGEQLTLEDKIVAGSLELMHEVFGHARIREIAPNLLHVEYRNGYIVSLDWGAGSWSDNKDTHLDEENAGLTFSDILYQPYTSRTFEVGIWKNGELLPEYEGEKLPFGVQSPRQVIRLLLNVMSWDSIR